MAQFLIVIHQQRGLGERFSQRQKSFPTGKKIALIGSGTVEATCKTLAAVRMKGAGCRWTLDGGRAILALRSLATSGLWPTAANFLVEQATRDVQSRVAA